jgi:hypothetical protein
LDNTVLLPSDDIRRYYTEFGRLPKRSKERYNTVGILGSPAKTKKGLEIPIEREP